MGCDIHIALERKVGNKWVMVNVMHWDRPCTKRDYRRFAALAGVRGEGPAPRGVPADVSDSAKLLIDDWGDDGHSHSWMTIEEAVPIFLATERVPDEYGRTYPLGHYFGIDRAEHKSHRIVFFFDS